ncbi:TonB-dependent receptor plug domain-containing protein, partial [Salmonella sp. s51944]|uniref:TonB-dependent receptor plug domain-containing protein n=1 Tax=Salmonella sp. s51944 TaxID=3159655 RepID=UPI0039813B7C
NARLAAVEGSAEAGYRVENVKNVGALGGMKLQDTPYSMSVVSQEFLTNTQTTSLDDVFKRNPATQLYGPRFTNGADAGNFIEDTEQLEIITGLTGFLYGPATP